MENINEKYFPYTKVQSEGTKSELIMESEQNKYFCPIHGVINVEPAPEHVTVKSDSDHIADSNLKYTSHNGHSTQHNTYTIPTHSTVTPTNGNFTRPFSAKSTSDVNMFNDDFSHDNYPHRNSLESHEASFSQSIHSEPDNIGGHVSTNYLDTFNRPLRNRSNTPHGSSKIDRILIKRMTSEFEPIQEVSIEDDDLFTQSNSFRETVIDNNTGKVIKSLPVFDPDIKYHNYSVVDRIEGNFENNKSISSSFSNLNSKPENTVKTTKNKRVLKKWFPLPPKKRQPISFRPQVPKLKIKRNLIKPTQNQNRPNAVQPTKRNSFSQKVRQNKMITSTATKKLFYLSKTRLVGQVTERIKDTRMVPSNNFDKKRTAPLPYQRKIKNSNHNQNYVAPMATNQYDENPLFQKNSFPTLAIKKRVEYSTDDLESESSIESRGQIYDSSSPILVVNRSNSRRMMATNEPNHKIVPYSIKPRNYLIDSAPVKSFSRNNDFNRPTSKQTCIKNDDRILLVASRLQYERPKTQLLEVIPIREQEKPVAIGTLLRNKDGSVFISPGPENKTYSIEENRLAEYLLDLRDKSFEDYEMTIEVVDEKKKAPMKKRLIELKELPSSVVWCCECNSKSNSCNLPQKFCAFQCWTILIIAILIILIVSALIGTIVYFSTKA